MLGTAISLWLVLDQPLEWVWGGVLKLSSVMITANMIVRSLFTLVGTFVGCVASFCGQHVDSSWFERSPYLSNKIEERGNAEQRNSLRHLETQSSSFVKWILKRLGPPFNSGSLDPSHTSGT